MAPEFAVGLDLCAKLVRSADADESRATNLGHCCRTIQSPVSGCVSQSAARSSPELWGTTDAEINASSVDSPEPLLLLMLIVFM